MMALKVAQKIMQATTANGFILNMKQASIANINTATPLIII